MAGGKQSKLYFQRKQENNAMNQVGYINKEQQRRFFAGSSGPISVHDRFLV